MSAEFADAEGCPSRVDIPDKAARIREIVSLQEKLQAVSVLENIGHAVRGTTLPTSPGYRPTHFLIRFDSLSRTVAVEPHTIPKKAAASYGNAEESQNKSGEDQHTVVLVEADKIENLKLAYPNYFGDVEFFKQQLRALAHGKSAVEYTAVPRPPASKKIPEERVDPAWLMRSRFPKPSLRKAKRRRR